MGTPKTYNGMGYYIGEVHTLLDTDGWQVINKNNEVIAKGIKFHGDADRIKESLNSCLPFEHPESDVKKLIEALKRVIEESNLEQTGNDDRPVLLRMNYDSFRNACEALALFQDTDNQDDEVKIKNILDKHFKE